MHHNQKFKTDITMVTTMANAIIIGEIDRFHLLMTGIDGQ